MRWSVVMLCCACGKTLPEGCAVVMFRSKSHCCGCLSCAVPLPKSFPSYYPDVTDKEALKCQHDQMLIATKKKARKSLRAAAWSDATLICSMR